jgi:hypothetical protein
MKSKNATELRNYIDLWLESDAILKKSEGSDKIKTLLDANGFVLYFKNGSSLLAAPEESRVVFARMKNPDEETPKAAQKEASFLAIDLDRALEGEKVEKIISFSEIDKIKVIDRDDAEKLLIKRMTDPQNIKTDISHEV